MELKKMKNRIGTILLNDEHARNDDKHLTITYWKLYDMNSNTFTVDDYMTRLTDPNTITRVRRAIQRKAMEDNDTRLVPTNINVVKQRKMDASKWKTFMKYEGQGYLWDTIEKSL